jgi:hypothetical protein
MMTPPFRIFHDKGHDGILCLVCCRLSWNANDVKNRYCAHCGVFLADLPPLLRCDTVEAGRVSLGLLEAEHERAAQDPAISALPVCSDAQQARLRWFLMDLLGRFAREGWDGPWRAQHAQLLRLKAAAATPRNAPPVEDPTP